MRRFSAATLFEALDAERLRRETSWAAISAEIGVSVSTMRRLKQGGRLEVDGALAMVGWLGKSIEDFTIETDW